MLASEMRDLTPEEVDARLPLLRRIAEDIIEAWTCRRVLRERRRVAGRGVTPSIPAANSSAEAPSPREGTVMEGTAKETPSLDLAAREEERRLTQLLVTLSMEIETLGGTLLDPSTGTFEFPSLLDGKLVMLSWRAGEERVQCYRPLDAPRSERRILPGRGTPPEGVDPRAAEADHFADDLQADHREAEGFATEALETDEFEGGDGQEFDRDREPESTV